MENWLTNAEYLITNRTIIDYKNYYALSSVKSQGMNLIPYASLVEKQRLIKIIDMISSLLIFNKKDIKNIIPDKRDIENEMEQLVLIVLGCKDKNEQSKRVQSLLNYLIQYFKKKTNFKIIFSGGGYDINTSEALAMQNEFLEIAKSHNLSLEDVDLFCESDSMDTVGNALFSRHIINSFIIETTQIRVFTSTFHVKRTHTIFAHVFDPATLTVFGTNDYEFDDILLESELISEYLSDTTIFTLKCGYKDIKLTHHDWRIGMMQLFLNHDLYKKRYDLMRKYKGSDASNVLF
jgi:hypothetical protein